MNVHLKRKLKKIISCVYRLNLKNRNFTIISNNCWGGGVYDSYGLKYLTPTIGLYFFSKDYIKFISNLKYYLSLDVQPLDIEHSKYKSVLENKKGVMLGKLDDIELVFVHYSSLDEAIRKWNYRRHRVNFKNIIVKYNDQNLFSDIDYQMFSRIQYPKIFFTSQKKYEGKNDVVYFKCYQGENYVLDDISAYKKYINITKKLNSII